MLPEKLFHEFSVGTPDADQLNVELLGGKGAGLQEMCALNIPVPPGFTISTAVCKAYTETKSPGAIMTTLANGAKDRVHGMSAFMGHAPLVSVRSGAPISMPGMMDTILNVGITTHNMASWKERLGERAALDSYRRLIQMYGTVVKGIEPALFEDILSKVKFSAEIKEDSDLTIFNLEVVVKEFTAIYKATTREEFPDTLFDQLYGAIGAVFDSWNNDRAKSYRALNGIDDNMGTAVTIQAMVFGNMNDKSGSGVAFTRDPSLGKRGLMGEFLMNAQGEDVVAGIRTPHPLSELPEAHNHIFDALCDIGERLENHYCDMQDLEFTIQDGTLWILQCRSGKRSAQAAFKIAVDLVEEKIIPKSAVFDRISPAQFHVMSRPHLVEPTPEPSLTGLPACPGVALGVAVFSAEAAVASAIPAILVTSETVPDDIDGMNAAVGILTATGGATSHAAVVARAMDKPCIVGADNLEVFDAHATIEIDGVLQSISEGHPLTVNGSTGHVWLGNLPLEENGDDENMAKVVQWMLERPTVIHRVNKLSDANKRTKQVHLMAAAWYPHATGPINALVNRYKFKPADQEIVLQLTSPADYMDQADKQVLCAFGEAALTQYDPWMAEVVGCLLMMKDKLKGLTVVAPTKSVEKELKKAGFNVVTEVSSIIELLKAKTAVQLPPNLDTLVGGKDVLKELQKVMKEAGRETIVIQDGLYQEELVYDNFRR